MRITIGCCDLMHDLHHGIAGLFIQRAIPEFLKPRMRFDIIDALVVREHHRNQSGITRTLHIVLTAQRVQARAGLTNLTGNADECN